MHFMFSRSYQRCSFWVAVLFIGILFFTVFYSCGGHTQESTPVAKDTLVEYQPQDTSSLKDDAYGALVKYGAKLMQNTAYYIGPKGTQGRYLGNEMTCTNCHLDRGAKTFGNSLYTTHKAYPQFRARENRVLTIADRVNNCIERPHSGIPLPLDSKEMLAFVTYIQWLGKDYDETMHYGHGIKTIDYKGKRSNPEAGALVYEKHCKSCHMADGQGVFDSTRSAYVNPPLWGKYSYQEGSSMHRVIKSASFIYHNMPRTVTWDKPVLTVQEALDVAGFVNSYLIHERPKGKDPNYPDIRFKPIDYFRGPYNDTFSAYQHTFGPWEAIEAAAKK